MMNPKELSLREDMLAPGHRMCPGCAAPIIVRMIMLAAKNPIVVVTATGCLEVSTTLYPYTSWKVPWLHNAFENAAATLSGIETAYNVLKRKGLIKDTIKFLAFGGDGATYDIGLQSLSGACERGHDFVYVCYDNGAYMNTGIQRSSSTPFGADTKTTPVGHTSFGKSRYKKDITAILAEHHIPYVAQASPHNYMDLLKKAEKAFEIRGPAFLNILSPCVPGWGYSSEKTLELAKLAVDTCYWPLFHIENDVWALDYDPLDKKLPIIEWLRPQSRFRHLLKPENAHIITAMQEHIDKEWAVLKKRCVLRE